MCKIKSFGRGMELVISLIIGYVARIPGLLLVSKKLFIKPTVRCRDGTHKP